MIIYYIPLHKRQCLVNPRRACRVTVVGSVCVCVCPLSKNDTTYLTGNEGQKNCCRARAIPV